VLRGAGSSLHENDFSRIAEAHVCQPAKVDAAGHGLPRTVAAIPGDNELLCGMRMVAINEGAHQPSRHVVHGERRVSRVSHPVLNDSRAPDGYRFFENELMRRIEQGEDG
jgi:hypothetical protein